MITKNAAKPLDRREMAARLARDIPEGWYVNLGLGLPTLVPDHIPPGREVVFHSENGVLGMGPVPSKDKVDTWLVNATKQNITLIAGASLFHHADSFGMIRGGHLDLCVLGAYEVPGGEELHRRVLGERGTDGVRPDGGLGPVRPGQEAEVVGQPPDPHGALAPQHETVGRGDHHQVLGVLGDRREAGPQLR